MSRARWSALILYGAAEGWGHCPRQAWQMEQTKPQPLSPTPRLPRATSHSHNSTHTWHQRVRHSQYALTVTMQAAMALARTHWLPSILGTSVTRGTPQAHALLPSAPDPASLPQQEGCYCPTPNVLSSLGRTEDQIDEQEIRCWSGRWTRCGDRERSRKCACVLVREMDQEV